jgi:hypothetical protein
MTIPIFLHLNRTQLSIILFTIKGVTEISPREVVSIMPEKKKYHFESFSYEKGSFDSRFTDFMNSKFDSGWDYKECYYDTEGDTKTAFCLFKRIG